MEREVARDDIPAPGEPLLPEIHPDNVRLLDAEIQARIDRLRAKLTRRELKRIKRRITQIDRQLSAAGYHRMVAQRAELHAEYMRLRAVGWADLSYHLRAKSKRIRRDGLRLNRGIAGLANLTDERDELAGRVTAHEDVVAWEREDAENRAAFIKEVRTFETLLQTAFRHIARLHHQVADSDGKVKTIIPQIGEIIVKDDKLLFSIITTKQGPLDRMIGRWRDALPYNVSIADMVDEKTLVEISGFVNRVVTVERSKRGTNFFYVISRLDSPDGIPRRILYHSVLDHYPVDQHRDLPWCTGAGDDRKFIWHTFADHPHVLIAGATQGGKSNMVNQMISTLATMNRPDELRLLLIDLKGGIEFSHWAALPHLYRPIVRDEGDVIPALEQLQAIMQRRFAHLEAASAKKLSDYNRVSDRPLPRIVCVIDELATMIGLGEMTTAMHTALAVLSAQGRAVGIHLVMCTQHSSVEVLPGRVKTNLALRISFRMPSHSAAMTIMDSVTPATLPDVPGRFVESLGRYETIGQAPLITDGEIARAIKDCKAYPPADDTEFVKGLPEPVQPWGRDDLLQVVMEELGGRLSGDRVGNVVGPRIATLRECRAIVAGIRDEWEDHGYFEWRGNRYTLFRVGNAYRVTEWRNNDDDGTESDVESVESDVESESRAVGD